MFFLQTQTETLPDPEHLVVMPSDVAFSSQQQPESKRNTDFGFMLLHTAQIQNKRHGDIIFHGDIS